MKKIIARTLAAGIALGVCGSLLAGTAGPASPAHAAIVQGKEELIGQLPGSREPSVPNFGTTTSPDGRPVAIVVSGGDGGVLNVIDLKDRKVVAQQPFAESGNDIQAWGFATLPDGKVLIAVNKGKLYEVAPVKENGQDAYKVTQLGAPQDQGLTPSKGFWDMTSDEQGRVYIASSLDENRGQVYSYDPASRTWGTLGDSTNGIVQTVAYENGTVYSASTTAEAVLRRISTNGQDRGKDLPVPAEITQKGANIQHLEVHGGRLYATTSQGSDKQHPCGGACVLDPSTGAVTGQVPSWSSHIVTRPGEASKVYYRVETQGGAAGRLMEYDPANGQSTQVFELTGMGGRLSPASWASQDLFASSEMNMSKLSVYDATSQQAANLPDEAIAPSPRIIQAMTAAPGGDLYASWFMTAPDLLRITPAASPTAFSYEHLSAASPGQPEGIGATDEWVVTGIYPKGRIGARSLKTGQVQPEQPIGQNQNRPYVVTPISGSLFAIGSIPADGSHGGALTIYDAAAGKIVSVHPVEQLDDGAAIPADSLQGLSPISIVHRDGKLYIGMTTRGGSMNDAPSSNTPKIIEFDLASKRATKIATVPLIDESNNDKRQKAVRALTFGDDGKLYGTTGSHMLSINPATLAIERNEEFKMGYPEINAGQLIYRDGVLYTTSAGRLHAVRANDFSQHQVLVEDSAGLDKLVLAADGSFYYVRGANALHRYTFS